jgi:peptidoglycan/LPS O-acetylase OafA/YrhL
MTNNHHGARNFNVDMLRAIAILLVMIVHFPRLRQYLPFLNPWSGVDLFFAISGFVVANSFVPQLDKSLRELKDVSHKSALIARHIKAFFVRRFMRIMPALCFALAFYLVVGLSIGEPNLASLTDVFAEIFAIFTYTANFFAGYRGATTLGWHWSLAAEEQFYFLFPFFVALIPSTKLRVWATIFCIALITFVVRPYGGKWFGDAPAAMYLPQFRNDSLGYGFLVFIAHQQSWFKPLEPIVLTKNNFLRTLAITVLVFTVALAPQMALNFNIAIPIIGCCSALLILLALWSEQALVSFKPIAFVFNWIGLRSYGLYLLHIPIVRLIQHAESQYFNHLLPNSYIAHFLSIVVCLGVIVEICFHLVEKPMMRLGKTWSVNILKS